MKDKWLVGVDIGGTTIKLAFLTQNGAILRKWEIPTDTSMNGSNIPDDIARELRNQLARMGQDRNDVLGIGIGAPGPVNIKTGSVDVAVNLGWVSFPLQERLEQATGLPVVVDNDANIAALGEMWKGAGEGARDLICVTLGTGVGGGIISNGAIVRGVNGSAGEIGHIAAIPEGGAPCNCGKTGCLETVASATGIVRMAMVEVHTSYESSSLRTYLETGSSLTAKVVFEAAKAGDNLASKVIRELTFHLGIALANLANGTNPQKIVIGGGVSQAGNALIVPLRQQFVRFTFPRVAIGAKIVLATLGNDAGVTGGARLALDACKQKMLII
ncbi:ROK family glucokinase [Brevibacillus laterosporus]|uniref:Glucokinase n=1 Tax=Brevibacillus laterosporus TaxID=1465 RepID=A0A518V321_BRELA|nr:ROK family glucokinase [Brevibacillus laterosporus]